MATPEEHNARDTLERIKEKVEALIVQMENALATNPTPTSALWRRIKNAEKAWTEFEGQYDQLHAIAGENQAEQHHTYHVALQRCYLEVHARAEDALDDDKHRSGTRNCSNPSRKPRRSWLTRIGVTAASRQVTKLPSVPARCRTAPRQLTA